MQSYAESTHLVSTISSSQSSRRTLMKRLPLAPRRSKRGVDAWLSLFLVISLLIGPFQSSFMYQPGSSSLRDNIGSDNKLVSISALPQAHGNPMPAVAAVTGPAGDNNEPSKPAAFQHPDFGKLPIAFEPNAGQTDPSVRFMAHVSGGTLFFTSSGVVLTLKGKVLRTIKGQEEGLSESLGLTGDSYKDQVPSLHMSFVDANDSSIVQGGERLEGKVNYIFGSDSSNWQTNLPTYSGITYTELYSGVDIAYTGTGGQLKGTYTIAPGADPSQIVWRYSGAEALSVDNAGNLQIRLGLGQDAATVTEQAPIAWQEIGGRKLPIDVKYEVINGTIGFALGSYAPSFPLTIDPSLTYSTYLGGSGQDVSNGIAVDSAGSIYITGSTVSSNFPTQNPYQSTLSGQTDVFVTKFNPCGCGLVYSTYIGGTTAGIGSSGVDVAEDIAVDGAGYAYITGYTGSYSTVSPNIPYPTTSGAFQTIHHGGSSSYSTRHDAFITKLSTDGSSLVYSTFLGGGPTSSTTGDDVGQSIAVDSAGNAYVTGLTSSHSLGNQYPFPTTTNAFDTTFDSYVDAFVTKLNASGSGLVYSSYLGGSQPGGPAGTGNDQGRGIVVDSAGFAYVVGFTDSTTGFPVVGAYQSTLQGGTDAFVTKVNQSGSAVVYSTYLGGDWNDLGNDIALDRTGAAYLTGETQFNDFPTTVNAYQTTGGGQKDAFVTKMNTSGSGLLYSTYLGGLSNDIGYGIAVDGADNVHITGSAISTNFPTLNPVQGTNAGSSDAFVTMLKASGSSLVYSTYLGGTSSDEALGIAVDMLGNTYIAGSTQSSAFPTVNPYQSTQAGLGDAFVSKIYDLGDTPPDNALRGGTTLCCTSNTGQPINTATGNFWHTFEDLFIPGRGIPLEFSRTYNAQESDQTGPLGYGWTHNYYMYITRDAYNNYLVHQENGSVAYFRSDLSHPAWVKATLANNSGVYTFTRVHGQVRYIFSTVNSVLRLTEIKDRNDYSTLLSYYTDGRLQTVTDPASRTLTFLYEDTTRTSLLTGVREDTSNRTVSFSYGTTGSELLSATDVGQQSVDFTYETVGGFHRMLIMEDPRGGTVTNTYDTKNRAVTQVDAMGRTMQIGYYDLGDNTVSTRITDTLNLVTVQEYSYNMLRSVLDNATASQNQQATTTFNYQPGTTFTSSVTDPNGNTSSSTYDSNGNMLSSTDPLARTTYYAYNSANDPTIITHTNQLTTTFGYDTRGNLTSITRPRTETNELITTALTYDTVHYGDVLTVTNPLGKSWGMTYDTYGYLQSAKNPLNETSTYNHNSIGQLLSETDPLSHTSTYTYTLYGEPRVITNNLTYTTTYTYDPVGNLVNVTDANFKTITNTYNLNNELTRATRPDGTHSDYAYDAGGRVLTQTNGLSQSTIYTYDDLNRRVTVKDPLNRSTIAAYDLVGNTTVITDAMTQTITLGYDAAYQLRSVNYQDTNTPDVSYNYNSLGMRTVMTDGTGTNLYSYDSLDRPVSVQHGSGKTVTYGYDNGSRLTSIGYPNPAGSGTVTVTRGYNDANRLTSVQDWLSHTSTFGYDADGKLSGITYANGLTATVGYNGGDQLTSIVHNNAGSPFINLTYTPDPVGLLDTSVEVNGTRTSNHDYAYDRRYRVEGDGLTGTSSISSTWGYDAATQITQTTYIPSGGKTLSTTRTYDAANQLLGIVEKENNVTVKDWDFTYNRRGNRTQQHDSINSVTKNLGYNQANELTSLGLWSYGYNGDGIRMSKGGMISSEQFTWDIGVEAGLPLLLQDGQASFIYGPGGMLLEEVQTSDSSVNYYHSDRLGSVRALTNSAGSVVNTYEYDAYGQRTSTTGSTYNPFGYTGEYTDQESGLIYLRARYYDPSTQQFLTVDPLLAQTEEAYAYVSGNPTNGADPSGLWSIGFCTSGGIAGIFGLGITRCYVATLDGLRPMDIGEQITGSTQWGINGGATVNAGPLISNATRLGQLEQGSTGFGGSWGTFGPAFFGIGGEYSTTKSVDANWCTVDIWNVNPQGQVGIGTPIEAHVNNSYTVTVWAIGDITSTAEAIVARSKLWWQYDSPWSNPWGYVPHP